MSPARFRRRVRRELAALRREGVLDDAGFSALAARYPDAGWDWRSLGRWFAIFGGISAAAGVVLLGRELLGFSLARLAAVLGVCIVAAFAGGLRLRRRGGYHWTPRGLELLGGLLVIALTFTVGAIVSAGSGNWPALLLIDLGVLLVLAYVLDNLLLLVAAAVVFFAWFGGATGYASGWGVYWFGMSYPLRFLLAGLAVALAGGLHRLAEAGPLARYRGFFLVWLSAGVFFAEMALWLLSLFGSFELSEGFHRAGAGELWLFNLAWLGLNAALMSLGVRYRLRMLRGYAWTFLVIQGYTQFFRFFGHALGPVLTGFVMGAATLALVVWAERRRREASGTG